MESKVLISGNYSFNVKQTTGGAHGSGVNIYLYGCASLVIPMCVVCLCVCLRFQIRAVVKNHMSQASVNLTPIKIAVGLVLIYIAGGVNIYLYGCISLAPVCAVCQCVCLCDIKSEF